MIEVKTIGYYSDRLMIDIISNFLNREDKKCENTSKK